MAQFLTQHQIVTLSVSSSTTAGRRLTDEEWHCVDQIASYMEQVLSIQGKLTQYIAQQMETLAPSVCALVGPKVAAKLVALTGGLPQLAKIPACNLQVLGQAKHTSNSRSTVVIAGSSSSSAAAMRQQPHQGVLVECDLVQRSPRTMRSKALKLVAAKLALAVRHDHVNVDTGRPRSAEAGLQFRMQIEQKLVQLQEPDKAPVLKALPK
jgi:U4/U6 small nuclear ribonucleoprotein PRP31